VIAAAPDPDLPARRAVGVGEIARHLAGEIGIDEALELFRRATRQYAKRQVTWFRHQAQADLVLDEQFSESLMPSVFRFIRETG
jgi:tRNA dimethylallyltransferase